jgi:hypothetical protein
MTEAAERAFREIAKHYEIERVPNDDYRYEVTKRDGSTYILFESELEDFAKNVLN